VLKSQLVKAWVLIGHCQNECPKIVITTKYHGWNLYERGVMFVQQQRVAAAGGVVCLIGRIAYTIGYSTGGLQFFPINLLLSCLVFFFSAELTVKTCL